MPEAPTGDHHRLRAHRLPVRGRPAGAGRRWATRSRPGPPTVTRTEDPAVEVRIRHRRREPAPCGRRRRGRPGSTRSRSASRGPAARTSTASSPISSACPVPERGPAAAWLALVVPSTGRASARTGPPGGRDGTRRAPPRCSARSPPTPTWPTVVPTPDGRAAVGTPEAARCAAGTAARSCRPSTSHRGGRVGRRRPGGRPRPPDHRRRAGTGRAPRRPPRPAHRRWRHLPRGAQPSRSSAPTSWVPAEARTP